MTAAAIVYEVETTAAAYKRLSRRLRSLPPPEKAAETRANGIEAIFEVDGIGPHFAILSLSEYPHERHVRPKRGGGWKCDCPSFDPCAHIYGAINYCAEEGEPRDITEWRREHA